MKSLEYTMSGSEIFHVTPTVNTRGSLLKIEDTTLKKLKPSQLFRKIELNQICNKGLSLKFEQLQPNRNL